MQRKMTLHTGVFLLIVALKMLNVEQSPEQKHLGLFLSRGTHILLAETQKSPRLMQCFLAKFAASELPLLDSAVSGRHRSRLNMPISCDKNNLTVRCSGYR